MPEYVFLRRSFGKQMGRADDECIEYDEEFDNTPSERAVVRLRLAQLPICSRCDDSNPEHKRHEKCIDMSFGPGSLSPFSLREIQCGCGCTTEHWWRMEFEAAATAPDYRFHHTFDLSGVRGVIYNGSDDYWKGTPIPTVVQGGGS